ncbi:hypothetical protein BJX96DRAFT_163243 [Aspergillus floccosus]
MDEHSHGVPTVQDLLNHGPPFVPFSEFSVQDVHDSLKDPASSWIDSKLREGKPFVIRGFNLIDKWDKDILNNKQLAASFSASLPVRNCQTGRDIKMKLRDLQSLTDNPRSSSTWEDLYAKDLQCPLKWQIALDAVLPSSLRHLGSLDLFRVLPKEIVPEVLMAYVGTRKSFSGFHRCFSATVALNLMIESKGPGPGSLCFGTDTDYQSDYDAFMSSLGKLSHTDWTNVSVSQLQSAGFPIYVTHQEPGDLVVFPSATAHQIWNVSPMVTKAVWNIMHTTSLVSFFDYVQPVYQRQCHTDTGRVPLIPMHALGSYHTNKNGMDVLLDIFQRLVDDEDVGDTSIPIKLVDTQGAVVECNFCGLTIWNRHLHCEKCGDFDLCLTCFISGRSCQHISDYTWAELVPRGKCRELLQTRQRPSTASTNQKSLGALAVEAAQARRQAAERLCHLCRDTHPSWKGVTCRHCSAFFCLRGLHRHFDIELLPFLRNENEWVCPKCAQMCNCRCCHFAHPYQSKDKPVRRRVRSIDPRGRITGFVDNVFDQKRGKRASVIAHGPRERLSSRAPGSSSATDQQVRINDLIGSQTPPIETSPFSGVQGQMTSPRGTENATFLGQNEPHETVSPESMPADDESIPSLEKKLEALRQYATELLELSLVESHGKILERIGQLEEEVERRRRLKAEVLFRRLQRDFPDLANVAREEARRRGW